MPDPRFFESLPPAGLDELASLAEAKLAAPSHGVALFSEAAILSRAGRRSVTYFADRRLADDLAATQAGACFLAESDRILAPPTCAVMISPTPQAAWARAVLRLHRPIRHETGAASIHPDCHLEDGVQLGPGVVVGQGAAIGRGSTISAGAVIGPGVAIGRDAYIGPNASVGFALIGDGVSIHGSAVVGEPGFGAVAGASGVVDVPQLGRVIIQDGVTIGAGSCVDRGAWDDTVIGENTKIDNFVQIAHNVVVGRNCVMAAFTGISGSVTIGDGCMFGGRVGIADHLTIGAGVRLAAAAGVMNHVPAGETWGGAPARPIGRWLRETVWLARAARRTKTGDGPP